MNESKQDQRKAQILDAALKVIVNKGFEQSRMDDIVAKSGLSKGAIYWYYKSKKDVYLSLVNHWVIKYSATLNHIVEKDLPASGQLHSLFHFFVDQYETDPAVFKAMVEFWALSGRDEDFHDKVQKVYSEFIYLVETILQYGVSNSEFYIDDTKTAALSIMINIEGIIWFTLFDVNNISVRSYMETVFRFIEAGLTTPSKELS
ncbi:MAG: TetR family transcriptional regulator [Simkaniaceae bacterium]|nr:TetR family transcriptional regulator [Simkaniaceae bacterium]